MGLVYLCMFKTNKMFLGRYLCTFLVLLLVTPLSAQLISNPELFFSDICQVENASSEYELAFEVDSSRFDNDNMFFIELSDANGVFLVDPVEVLATVANEANDDLVYAKFKFNNALYGENYSIRIVSTSPAAVSNPSVSFEGFTIENANMVLNNGEDVELNNTKPDATVSVNGSADKKYHWFKDGNFFSETLGTELNITEAGLYYVSTYYGKCTGLDFSNVIKVTQNTSSGKGVKLQKIVSPNGDTFNDYWELPKEYLERDIRVTILNQNGNILLDTNKYANNWPQNNGVSEKGIHNVVYYVIQEKGQLLHKGAITITQ